MNYQQKPADMRKGNKESNNLGRLNYKINNNKFTNNSKKLNNSC